MSVHSPVRLGQPGRPFRGMGESEGAIIPPTSVRLQSGDTWTPSEPFLGYPLPRTLALCYHDGMKREEWKSTGNCAYETWYHVVWSTKYRRKVLIPPVDEAAKELLQGICAKHGYEMKGLEVMSDHIHLFISVPPAQAVATAVKMIKGATARMLFTRVPPVDEAAMGRTPVESLVLRGHSRTGQQRDHPAVHRAPEASG